MPVTPISPMILKHAAPLSTRLVDFSRIKSCSASDVMPVWAGVADGVGAAVVTVAAGAAVVAGAAGAAGAAAVGTSDVAGAAGTSGVAGAAAAVVTVDAAGAAGAAAGASVAGAAGTSGIAGARVSILTGADVFEITVWVIVSVFLLIASVSFLISFSKLIFPPLLDVCS